MHPIPVPSIPAPEPRRGPVAVPPAPPKPRKWGWLASVIGITGIALAAWRYFAQAPDTTGTVGPIIRTAVASTNRLDRVLRLTGVTAAENAAQLLTPQLRGSRLGTNRDALGGVTAIAPLSVSSRTGGNTSPGATSSSNNLSTALRAATSRTGGAAAGSAQVSTSSSDSTSTTMGPDGIGTSAADLMARSQGGGGNGANDFFLVLQELVKPGSQVKKGQIVAEFDRQYMLTRLDDYKATVVQTEASLRRQLSDLAVARKAKEQQLLSAKGDYEKAKLDMRTIPVLSALDVQRTKLSLEETEAKYKQLEAELKFLTASEKAQVRGSELALEQTRGEFKRSETNVARLLVKAPIDGLTVMQTTWRGGDYGQVQEGDQLYPGQGFMSIVDPRSMIVNALVNQTDAERLRIGLKAHVRFDAYPDLELPARVYSIGGIPRSSGARGEWVKEIPVRLKLDRTDSRVLPDLSVAADVVIDSSDDESVVVPVASVFEEDGKSYVMVASAGQQNWERRAVELGHSNFTHVVIRSGLKPGERVAEDRVAGSKAN